MLHELPARHPSNRRGRAGDHVVRPSGQIGGQSERHEIGRGNGRGRRLDIAAAAHFHKTARRAFEFKGAVTGLIELIRFGVSADHQIHVTGG